MCRKTLEGVCEEYKVPGRTLQQRIEALKDAGVIEGRLYQWADELRLVGNEAAHDVSIEVTAQDASDAVDFTRAVLEYVYTFRDQFERFKQRRQKAEQDRRAKPAKRKAGPRKR